MEIYSFIFKIIPLFSVVSVIALAIASVFAYLTKKTVLTMMMAIGFFIQAIGVLVSILSKYQGRFTGEYVDMSNSVIGFAMSSIGLFLGSVSLCVFLYKEFKKSK